jgi:hypothetical protein
MNQKLQFGKEKLGVTLHTSCLDVKNSQGLVQKRKQSHLGNFSINSEFRSQDMHQPQK